MSEEIESVECNELIAALLEAAHALYMYTNSTNTLVVGVKEGVSESTIGIIAIEFDNKYPEIADIPLTVTVAHKRN